jgi:YVTN family beta-propeller protein
VSAEQLDVQQQLCNRRFALRAMRCDVAWLLAGCLLFPVAARAADLYVSDEHGGDVVVVNVDSGAVVARIAVGKRPRGMRLAPDHKRLYVALSGSAIAGPGVDESTLPPPDRRADGIGVIDVKQRRLLTTLPSGPDPETLAVSPDGRWLYVANEDAMQLSVINASTGKLRQAVRIGVEPEGVAVRPDGKVVYVTCEGTGAVYAIDTASMQVIAPIATLPRPRALVFSPDGNTGYVSDEVGAAITVFDTRTQKVLRNVNIAAAGDTLTRPMGVAVNAAGDRLYVTTGRGGALVEVDLNTSQVRRRMAGVGKRPWGLALNTAGTRAYTANGPSGDISDIDLATGRVDRRIHVGESPWGIVYRK